VAASVPQQFVDQFQQQGANTDLDLTGTGDLGARILAQVPEQFRTLVEPLIPNIVAGIHEAFSLAIGSAVWVGIGGAIIAAGAVLFLREAPMRTTFEIPAEAAPTEGALEAGVAAIEPS
jgi:hypothetical protein